MLFQVISYWAQASLSTQPTLKHKDTAPRQSPLMESKVNIGKFVLWEDSL